MKSSSNLQDKLFFLSGDGEMAKLVRDYDWSKTSIGAPDTWSCTLRTTVNIVLNSGFPMFLFWGEDLLCFYNDAYRPSLGVNGKHPAVGKKAPDVWEEVWDFVGPLVEQVMTTGKPVWFEDQYVPFYRNGKIEDIYWTFSYSAVYEENGTITGLLVTCTETTEKARIVERLKQSERRFDALVSAAPVGIILLMGENYVVELANDAFIAFARLPKDELIGKPIFETSPESEPYFSYILETVRKTGEPLYLYNHPFFVQVDGKDEQWFLNLIYHPYRDESNAIIGIMIMCQDVTKQMANSQ